MVENWIAINLPSLPYRVQNRTLFSLSVSETTLLTSHRMAYDNPSGLIAGSVVMEIVAAICVALRFYSRHWRKAPIIVADWLVLAAFVCGTGLTVMEIYGKVSPNSSKQD